MFSLPLRLVRPPFSRSLVSTVLLNRSWGQETLTTLRQEAKNRGLSTKGNKAVIIARIQQYDNTPSNPGSPRKLPASSARHASTEIAPSDVPISNPEIVPAPAGEKGIAPEISPNSNTLRSSSFLNVSLPDLAKPESAAPVQVPYVPDFWDSSKTSKKPLLEQPLPKVLVVADANAYRSGGLTSSLLEDAVQTGTVSSNNNEEPRPRAPVGIVSDVLEDLGLGQWEETKKNWRNLLS